MKVLVLGGTGFVGKSIVEKLTSLPQIETLSASRRDKGVSERARHISLDACSRTALFDAVTDCDVVINSVMGDGRSISEGAVALASAIKAVRAQSAHSKCLRLVHLSTQSVYGYAQGWVSESHPTVGTLGWYGQAKLDAEASLSRLTECGVAVDILRPGCIGGPASALWTDRIAHWLAKGLLGDLGPTGDGWSNLVDVDDVARATVTLATTPETQRRSMPMTQIFNLAAPDSPRWNNWFIDLAVALGHTPVQRISQSALYKNVWLKGIPLKILEKFVRRINSNASPIPPGIPPSLLDLWQQHIRLDATKVQTELGLAFTPYDEMLRRSVASIHNDRTKN